MKRIYSKNTTYAINNLIYQNYHKHSIYTNPIMMDSCAYPEDYAKRAVELNHGIISSVEHGYQGRYIESYEMAQQYNLKYLFGVEAYFVYDRFEKDNTNAHICLLAKNESGRKAINRILSEANLTGFYYRARIDYDLLMSLPENDVWITSACIGGINRYTKDNGKSEKLLEVWDKSKTIYNSPYELLVDKIHQKFGDNFYLEVQAHNTDIQRQANAEMIKLSSKYNIEIIAGVDSHYIYENDAWKRDYLQKSSGIFLEDEQGWYMDYPDGKTLFNRFKRQGILQDDEILIAIDNTNIFLSVQEYTSSIFNHEMKMPSAPKYQKMSQEEKQMTLMKIVRERWDEVKKDIPVAQHAHYMREIAKELDIIFKINHADYFLLNYEIIKDAVENRGGMITFSGRGCLTGDALVSCFDDGRYFNKMLKEVKIGDKVQGRDGQYHTVLNTMNYDIVEECVQINVNNTITTMTADHKVLTLVNNKETWIQAQDLNNLNVVLFYSKDNIRTEYNIKKIYRIFLQTKVYDLTVDGCHSYVANGFIVHNSGPSFYVNHLLGFTQIDRISSPITLYPERFLSTSRMSAGSLADIDFNCGNTPVFEDAQKFIMGEEHAYPMIAYGTMKPKAAWKMYCRAVDVDFETSNAISGKIDEYETDLKYWDEESGEDEPNVYDYIPEDLRGAFDGSKEFLGIVDSASRHPCGNILYSNDIKEEFGIVRLKSKGGRETIVACCDGKWCEKYLMLKNDLLTVACVKLNYLLYDRIGLPYMSLNKLLEECKEHPEVWNMYEKGYVIGLNQVEKPSTQRKVMKYKPKNISELSAFIAGIRPAFKSLVDKLINREHFEYGIPTLDKLLQTEELPESFILYQEQIMKILAFAGIPMGDCYTVIKSISKKRFEKIMHYKEQFMIGMETKLIEEEGISKEKAEETTKTIWGIIEDASAYGFNSSHSLSVSFDSLLAAYFKALYPYEFYEVYLNLQMERSDKAKALLAKKEMKEAFGISVLPMRFRQDNRKFVAIPEKKALSNCLKSIKGFGDKIGEELYKLKDIHFNNFIDFLKYIDIIKKNKVDSKEYNPDLPSGFAVNGTQIETLITLNYFEEFGCNYKLLKIKQIYDIFSSRKTINKNIINFDEGYIIIDKIKRKIEPEIFKKYIGKETKSTYKDLDMAGYINEISNLIPNKSLDLLEQLKFERELLEFPIYQNTELPQGWYYVLGFKTYGDKVSTPYLVLYSLVNSDLVVCSINKSKLFRDNPFGIYSIINVKNFQDVIKKKKVGEKKFIPTNETKKVIADYEVILRNEKEELQVLEQIEAEKKGKKEG